LLDGMSIRENYGSVDSSSQTFMITSEKWRGSYFRPVQSHATIGELLEDM